MVHVSGFHLCADQDIETLLFYYGFISFLPLKSFKRA